MSKRTSNAQRIRKRVWGAILKDSLRIAPEMATTPSNSAKAKNSYQAYLKKERVLNRRRLPSIDVDTALGLGFSVPVVTIVSLKRRSSHIDFSTSLESGHRLNQDLNAKAVDYLTEKGTR